jgi:uncharacterized membrane protein YphA (DoxX/SURF4 family)
MNSSHPTDPHAAPTTGNAAAPAVGRARLATLAAALVGLTMIVAGLAKLASPTTFVESITSYRLTPGHLSVLLGTGLVGGEIAVGFLLITGIFRRFAAWANLVLLVLFSGILVYAIKLGIRDCGCFGKLLEATPQISLVKNVVLLALTLVVLRWGRDAAVGNAGFRHAMAWGVLCISAAGFLAGSPAQKTSDPPRITSQDLALLSRADPPVTLPKQGLVFLFGADCSHCWSYAGGVQMIADRLPALPVIAVTSSGPQDVQDFIAAFRPTYPIHVLSETEFRLVAPEIPTAVWLRDGKVERAWRGEVPSHRELAMLGDYEIAAAPPPPASAPADSVRAAAALQAAPGGAPSAAALFGGPARARQH